MSGQETERGVRGMAGKGRVALAVVLFLAMSLAACSGTRRARPEAGDRMLVVASINPLADFARQIGGDRVQVETMVPPGASPHTYEPKPSQLRDLSRAKVLVLVGLGFEFWADKAISASGNPGLIVVRTSDGLEILQQGEGGGGNPHVWLDPIDAIHQVELIRDAFIRADPAGKEVYTANADEYIGRLRALDEEIRKEVSGFSTRKFIAFHPAWAYFARRYGLEQVAVIERTPGREPSPAEIAKIVQAAREAGVKAIFAEPQFSPKAAKVIAQECGAQVLFLDPVGGVKGRETYIELMRYNLAQMAKAMK